jgi:molybdopterin-guanine dinucleotide biosynthesis protein A
VYCPRKMLIQSDVHLLRLENPQALDNVNFPEEYEQARNRLHQAT